MKIIKFWICEAEKNQALNYPTEDLKNSLIEFRNGKFYFNSKFKNEPEQIKITFSIFNFDENLNRKVIQILKESHNKAEMISDEPISKWNENIFSEITTTINKYAYEECPSVFYFVAELFYKYLMGHKLINGNKRMSLMFLIFLLRFFGYHLPWSYGDKKNYKFYEEKLIKWVEIFQRNENNCKINKSQNIENIAKWIKKYSVIAIQFQ